MKTLRTIKNMGPAKSVFSAFFLSSMFLSMLITIRLLFNVDMILKKFNIVAYCILLFVIPMVAIVWLFNESWRRKSRSTWFFFFLLCIYVISWVVAFIGPFIPEYLLLWFPVPLMVFLHARWKNAGKGPNQRKTTAFLAFGLIIAVLLPNLTAYASTYSLLNQAAAMSELERASFISERVFETTAFGMMPRADTDYWKFLLTGVGMCREMSIAGVNLMSAAGLVARRIVFPGEDHALIEVNIGGNWFVADPGSYRGKLTSRAERAAQRVERVGSLSYVTAYTENGFIELTQQYVSTDTIVIRITRNGEPVADAQVVLKHRFRGIVTQLPGDDWTFHTDVNGNVTLHMGKLHYINEFKGSEEYYWIYVNGENTGYNVTSTGNGQDRLVKIDLG